ncbi:protease inhibitor I42 family protein [Legionella taurinensis]|nr:protease inhibitor I42 family protein [Legionella taurinensis]MDX1837102.1 protease inhibitor I42 family protein [Legionella taurinensis]STY26522.1 secreted protein [Legionella taurinensis]
MKKLIHGILLMLGFAAHAANNTAMTLNVAAGEEQFKVTLQANPTTGYQWTVQNYDQTLFKLMSSQYVAPQTKLIGAGGQMVFTFAVNEGVALPESSTMTFRYARPWEPKEGTTQQVIIQFKP